MNIYSKPLYLVVFLHKKAQRIYTHCASETMFLHRNHYSVFNVLFKDSNSIIIFVLPSTLYFRTTNCLRSLNSPATTTCIPSSTSARKLNYVQQSDSLHYPARTEPKGSSTFSTLVSSKLHLSMIS